MSVTTDAVFDGGRATAAAERPAAAAGGATTATGRIAHVEAIRGLACLMVVAYHVIGNDPAHGMRMAEGTAWWVVPRLLDAIQMPLFAFVSGWVFSIPTGDVGRFRAALGRKLLRLALPMASVSLFYLALATATGKAEGRGVLDVLVLPYQHLWYLQASLWLVAVAALGSLAFAGRPLAFAGVGLAVSLILFLPVPRLAPNPLAIEQAIYLAPFFFAGRLMRAAESEAFLRASSTRFAVAFAGTTIVALAAAVVTFAIFRAGGAEATPMQTAPAFVFAVAAAVILMLLRPRSRLVEAIGARSFGIYLFHVVFAAATREVVVKLVPGIASPVLFVVVFTVAVAAPYLLHGLLLRNRWSALIFLGESGGRR